MKKTDEEIEVNTESARLAADCRCGKQMASNFSEWNMYYEGHKEGQRAAQASEAEAEARGYQKAIDELKEDSRVFNEGFKFGIEYQKKEVKK